MIINSKTDFDNAPKSEQDKLKTRLAASIKQWQWVDGNWVLTDNTSDIAVYGLTIKDFDIIPEPEMPDYNPDDKAREQLEQEALEEQSRLRKEAMLTGQPYTLNGIEYQISFTANDGNGMLQVKSAFELGLTNTTIHFDNGTKMPITNVEFQDFGLWFVNQRNQYFIEVE